MNYNLDSFDEDVFNEAKSVMSAIFSEMLEAYIEDSQMYIDKIKDGFANNDKELIVHSAHPLKSSSAVLGGVSVSEIAKDIEYGAREAIENDTDVDGLEEMIKSVEEAFKGACIKIKELS